MAIVRLVLWAVLLSSSLVVSQNPGRCSMRGTCGYRDLYMPVPCPVDEAAAPVQAYHYLLLRHACPELVAEYGNNFCCDESQIQELVHNLYLPEALLAQCPSCYYNFRQSFCHFTCSPHQRQFFNITETELLPSEEWNPEAPLVESVKTADFYMTRDYAVGTYESCKNVWMDSVDGPVMNLLCGPWGAERCTYQRWFEYMGSYSNNYAPFDIRYNFVELPLSPGLASAADDREVLSYGTDAVPDPFHSNTPNCNESSPGARPCHCIDCPMSCPFCPSARTLE